MLHTVEQVIGNTFSEIFILRTSGPFGRATVAFALTKARIGRFVATDEPFLMLCLKYQLLEKRQLRKIYKNLVRVNPQISRTSDLRFARGEVS